MRSDVWLQANIDQRRSLLTLITRVGPGPVDQWNRSQGSTPNSSGQDALVRLFALHSGTTPLLLAADHEGRSILDRLSTLSVDPMVLRAVAPITESNVIASLLLEIADPGRIDQGLVGTCAPTSLEYQLAAYEPAEYVRLCAGLLSVDARVRMRGGAILARDNNSIGSSFSDPRTPTERIFQNAIMQASYPGEDYVSDKVGEGLRVEGSVLSTLPGWAQVLCRIFFPIGILLSLIHVTRREEPGLSDLGVTNAATQLSGRKYGALALDNTTDPLGWLRKRVPDGDFGGRGYYLGMMPFGSGGHELYIERIDYTASPPALIVRNPWGSMPPGIRSGDPIGQQLPIEVIAENPARGTIRIPLTPAIRKSSLMIHHPL